MEVCRICLENEDREKMISPCKCSGSQKFVHSKCLSRWQEAKLKNVLKYPELYQLSDIRTCNVCKTEYTKLPEMTNSTLSSLSYPLFSLFNRYYYSIIALLLSFGIFSGVLLIPFVINVLIVVLLIYLVSYFTGIRPKILITGTGFNLAFIRIGPAVNGLKPGIMIQASDKIEAGIFAGSTILITAYSPTEGAVGYIVNKPLSKLNVDDQRRLFVGGPVAPYSRHAIHNCETANGCSKVADGIYIGGLVNNLPPDSKCILCFGYAGWAPSQLDGEVRAKYWAITGEAKAEDLFS